MTSLRRIQAIIFEENVENRITTTNSLPLASSVHAGIHSVFDGFFEKIQFVKTEQLRLYILYKQVAAIKSSNSGNKEGQRLNSN